MSFFRSVTVSAETAAQSDNPIGKLCRQEIDGILVKGVYDIDACAHACAALEAGPADLVRTDFPAKFAAFFYGINLNLAHPDLGDYFAEAPRFRAALDALAGGRLQVQRRLSELMSALDGGRPYVPPPGPQPGTEYMFTTVRAHLPGGYIPAHFDDEQAARPSYRHLLPLIRRRLFSFVLAFSQGQQGGALEIFNLQPQQTGQRIAHEDRSAAKPDLDNLERVSVRLDPGDMILFDSGRYLHRVTPVVGAATRWTVCSFMAESADGSRVYCWG